jgi:predicted ATPase
MARTGEYQEGEMWLDLACERLWRGTTALRLRRTSFAVLRFLMAHPGQVVSKNALLEAVWPETTVSDGVLMVCINELRTALGDPAQTPRYIETVHRRGYRWLGTRPLPVSPAAAGVPLAPPADPSPASTAAPQRPPGVHSPPLVVGRAVACAELQAWLAQARLGQRQVGFVTGEAGLGKTTVVDTLVAQVAQAPDLWLARGQCVEHYGTGEAYLPVLEALGQLCRGPDGAQVVAGLAQYAPTWLVQMPALLAADALEAVQRRVLGATRERMLRELTEALEMLTTKRTLVLVLEDLHWSDAATLDLVGALARRRAPARLLVVGTYRPVEVIVRAHPLQALKLDLILHRQCRELPLPLLSAADVAQYLGRRFGDGVGPAELAQALHRRTDGHPLFLVTVADALVQQGLMREVAGRWQTSAELAAVEAVMPESVQQMIAQQFDTLPAEIQGMLEAASVAGLEHTVAAVAAGVEAADETVEAQCASLAQRGQFVQAHGVEEWPDGTVTGRYGFRHTLYQQVLYEQVPVGRRLRLHRHIGRRLETGYGAQTGTRAAELAMHFERGRDTARAVRYRQQAATNALRRYAYQEAIGHLTRGLELLQTLPDTPARTQQEIDLHLALGPTFIATYGWRSDVGQTYARAHALCQQLGDPPQLFPTLRGLWRFYHTQGALPAARDVGEQLTQLAQRTAAPLLGLEAHDAFGTTLFYLGDYATARTHLEQGRAGTSALVPRDLVLRPDVVPGVRCLAIAAAALWCLGYPTQAITQCQEALSMAQALAHPYSLGFAQHQAAYLYSRCRQARTVQRWAEALLTLATAQGFAFFRGLGTCWQGWALVMQGQGPAGLAQLQQGLTAVRATGQRLGQPLCLVLFAEAAGQAGHIEEGLRLLAEALAVFEATGRGDMLAEAYRLQGELLLQQAIPDAVQAEACFQEALAISQRQQATSWELRAAMSLARLWQRQGRRQAAYQLLAEVYGGFTEGFDTADLQEAKALLEALGG